jgi:tetratricopeptide (TPR) repeat protein
MGRVCLLVILTLQSLAWAQDPSSLSAEERTRRAKALFEQGRAHVNLGDYATATTEFEQAYVLKPLPLFLYNLAELAAFQGQRERAVQLYSRYLQEEKDPKLRAEVERRIAKLHMSPGKEPAAAPPPPGGTKPRPVEPPPSAPPPTTLPAPAPLTTLPATATATTATAPAARSRPQRRWIWGVAAGAAVVIGGAITLAVIFGPSPVDPTPSLGSGHLQ